ncbi:endonuclease/exonuclease/phosphatase family protein [Photobacterium aquimaris]|uniref:endonuclease/exonuclease/phosphatase family protein n=1 Tax=Photobacterium aquimaris TaxID=512643 RepID=UPI00076A372B|nr:endonuclease/exonuclease/phosphatase family protein [Photobacterium aquimaris]OBU22988.1 exodeoxyribonuclease III [Photobacterium aquimaris]PQJ38753.1 exodeoxyribonuclease III [Photobacterium aquimaris]
MKLLTLNTHSWQEEDQYQKLDIVAQAIIEQGCDVIALQEVNQHSLSDIISDQILSNHPVRKDNYGYLLQQKLAQLGHHYQLTWDFVHQSYEVYQEGLAFLTRLPIVERRVIDLNDNYDESDWKHRRAVRITVAYQHQHIDFYNCHCGWWNDQESPFEDHLNRITATLSSRLSCLLGDFNNPSHIRDQGYDYALHCNLYDCFVLAQSKDNGTTVVKNIDGWQQNNQALRLDYIFANQPVIVPQHQVIFNGDFYDVVSDHFGVIAEVSICTD